jgi:hypothetical protein
MVLNSFKMRGGRYEMPNAAHPLFLLHVRPAQAAAAHELRARVKHASVVDHNSLRNTMNTE